MPEEAAPRRLAAILSADAVGFSRLMGRDEDAAIRTVREHQRRIERLVVTFRGRVVDSPGDNLLAEFPSAIASVRCAIEIQRVLEVENGKLDTEQQMPFRIGVHLGDVIAEGDRIYGDGVNIAARLEGLAEPGGICLSDAVYQQVRRRLELAAADLGERELKNIEGPVRAHAIRGRAGVAAGAGSAARVALTPPQGPSLAVLPFVNMSGDPAHEYFGDGLTIDVLEQLLRLPGLLLIGQDAMFSYKQTAAAPRDVARELGVRHVLEGGVRRAERRVRVSARLFDASSGRYVWAEHYDRLVEDLFAVQDDITWRVVTELDVRLVGGEDARLVRQQVRTPEALALMYRGFEHLHRFTRVDNQRARDLFEQASQLEPDSPMPLADVGWTHYFDVQRGWSDDPAGSLERMAEVCGRALERGDLSGFAHLMLGHLWLLRREHGEALRLADQALAERPSCQAAYGLKGNILNYSGRPAEAVAFAQRAIRLVPVTAPFYPEVLAMAHYLLGDFDAALASAIETVARAPDSIDARVVLLASHVARARRDAAREAAGEILSIDPGFTRARYAASQPFRDGAVRVRLDAALADAGIPAGAAPAGAERLALPHASAPRQRVLPRPRRA